MNQHDLLTALDNFPRPGSYDDALTEASRLMQLAAAEIRRLAPQIEPLTDEESAAVSAIFDRLGSPEAGL
jgi:hypothetical protein